MLWQHRMDMPIGVWDEVVEDGKGLRVKGRILSSVQQGAEAIALIGAGALDGLSIGFRTVADEVDGKVRRLKEVDLYEVSFVTMPADQKARVTGIKTERDFEGLLRDNGFSRWDAKIIIASGYKAWLDQRDAEGDGLGTDQRDAEVAELVQAIKRNLKGVS
jgi:phage head maturation protease